MTYKQLNIYTTSEAVYLLTTKLSELGITGFVIHDSADFKEFIENKSANWDYIDDSLMELQKTPTYITAYLTDDDQGQECLTAVRGMLDELRKQSDLYGDLRLELDSVREEDWENSWKEYYKPFPVGERLLIKPTWENVPHTDRLILEIDPASTFGTGQHHTTRLCLEALEQLVPPHAAMLDLGCGSGILSIAGLLLGARHASLVDVFDNAVKTAGENIKQNHFTEESFSAYCGNITEDTALRARLGTGFDIITANIVADVIISMSIFFGELLAPAGTLIVSGIITERLSEVSAALTEHGLTVAEERESGGWHALICRRN